MADSGSELSQVEEGSSSSSETAVVSEEVGPRTYDVFLSFRGDTRRNFIDVLYYALLDRGFHVFRDDKELERGAEIESKLLKAIDESRVSIIVFSKNYASSRWCLDELVKIMECRRTSRQFVLPVFYDVDPSDVRWQRGTYEDAFASHQKRYGDGKVQRWRAALKEAADLSGLVLGDGHQGTFIRSIIEVVKDKLDPTCLSVADYPVGIDSRVEKLREMLSLGSNDVQIIAIWGMGGIGKTATAKALYNLIHRKFDSSCFLQNVGATWKQCNGPVELQKMLLSDILRDKNQSIRNSDHGIEVIKRRAWCRRVLLVLDDVDDVHQLRALAINPDLLHPGSRIIVTTRNLSSLSSLHVTEIYKPEELNEEESLELFNWHAFGKYGPSKDYEMLSKEVVNYAKGLPLVLETLGSLLSEKTLICEWISELKKLKKIPPDDVQGKLKLSFDSLDGVRQGLFLHIACFFVGMEQYLPIRILEGCNLFPEDGIGVLVRRCLVRIDSGNRLMMHDLIRDMGREIVRQKSPNEPGERSRLWNHEDILDVLKSNTGTKSVEGLVLNLPRSNELRLDAKAFAQMNNLRLLHLNYVHLLGSYEHLSKRIVWLCWRGFPLKCIPSAFYMDKTVAIDLSYSSLKEVWRETKVLNKLKYLNLSHSYLLNKTPDFTGLTSLEMLLLNNCTKLVEVHRSIGCLQNLVVLNLKNCQNLCKLPQSLFILKSLKHLDLSGCSKLGEPADRSWYSICSSLVSLTRSPDSIQLLPASIQGLSKISKLYLEDCNISIVPSEIGSLTSLQFLNLSKNKFSSLPATITSLPQLKGLYLNHCTGLQTLPGIPMKFKGLSANYCTSLESISIESKVDEAPFMTFYGCQKLIDNNFANDFRKILLQYQGLPEQGDFSIFLPGSEVPYWCHYQSMGSILTFVVPPLVDRKIQGWIVCIVFAGHRSDNDDDMIAISYGIRNKTVGVTRHYQPTVDSYPNKRCEDQMWLNYVPHRYLESDKNQLESRLKAGDEVEMSVRIEQGWRVKKYGVSLIYEGDEQDPESYDKAFTEYPLSCEGASVPRRLTDHSFLSDIGVLKSTKRDYSSAFGFPTMNDLTKHQRRASE